MPAAFAAPAGMHGFEHVARPRRAALGLILMSLMAGRPLTSATALTSMPAGPAVAGQRPGTGKRLATIVERPMAIKFGRPLERSRPAPVEAQPPAERLDLAVRPRRNRRAEWARRMVREHVLTTDDLIWPLFLVDGDKVRAPVASMPDVERLSVDEAVRAAERAAKLTIPCLALFPYTDPGKRDDTGSEALNAENLVCRAIRAIKKEVPDIGILCDVALDPYTSHGHDGLMRDGVILNDETVAVLVRQALVQAEAGCDIIAPSDMMDGRVGAIRDGARCRRLPRRADHGLCGQIRLGLLRPVPRRGRLERDAHRRQAHLSDGPGQHRRGAARGRTRHRRRRRHGHGQAGPALSRHLAAGQRRPSACPPSPTKCRANMR